MPRSSCSFNKIKFAFVILFYFFIVPSRSYAQESKENDTPIDCSQIQTSNLEDGLSSDDIKINFCELDRDKDGIISFDEYKLFVDSTDSEESMQTGQTETLEQDSATEEAEIKSDLDKLAEKLSIQQSYLNGDAFFGSGSELLSSGSADPATLTYTLNSGEDTFRIDAAVIYKAYDGTFNQKLINKLVEAEKNNLSYDDIKDDLGSITGLTIAPVLEAHVSTSDNAANNSLQFQVPFVLRFTDAKPIAQTILEPRKEPEFPFLYAQHIIGAPKYETDRDFKTEVIGLDLLYTPTIPSIGMGTSIPLGNLEFRWRPLIGFELGHVLNNGDNLLSLPVDNFVRATGRLRVELALDKSLVLSGDYISRFDLTGNNDIHQYLDLSVVYYFDEKQRLSIGSSYKIGENAPRFENNEEISFFLGFKL